MTVASYHERATIGTDRRLERYRLDAPRDRRVIVSTGDRVHRRHREELSYVPFCNPHSGISTLNFT